MSRYDGLKDYRSVREHMLPECCDNCYADGLRAQGICKRCLENQAKNNEWIDTHLFIIDNSLRCYHNCDHDSFKKAKLRLPNERVRLYYGIELELNVDNFNVNDAMNGYEDDENEMMDLLSEFTRITNGLFVYEEDGSLENGIEFISRPCSYAFWTAPETVAMLRKGFQYLLDNGISCDDRQPNGNGFHVHISKSFFTAKCKPEDKKQGEVDCYKDFDWLFQVFQKQIEVIGGRPYSPDYSASKVDRLRNAIRGANGVTNLGTPYSLETKVKVKKGGMPASGDHGWAVNSTPMTIEARVFKATTDVDRILSVIELMRNFSHAVREGIPKGETFDGILHTKENKFLDKTIRRLLIERKKAGKKFDLAQELKDELEFKVTSENN